MASQSEELRKKRFELNRLVDPNWAGGKYGAPGIGGEEVLSALLPAGVGMGGRAVGAGVRGFNTAAKKLDPLADFISSPSGRQMLDSMGKTWIFNKLAKEIENRYGVGSQPWVRQEEKRSKARGDEWEKKRQEILGDFLDSMPHHKEKSQKVVNIGMGSTIRDVRAKQIEQAERKESVLDMLEQLQMQGASKKQIDDFVDHSGVAFNPDRESKVLHDSVLGVKELEQYYPNPDKAQVKAFPLDNSIINAVRTLRRERDETAAPGLAEKDSQELFKTDPEKWLWSLSGEEVLGHEGIDQKILMNALEAQGIDPHAFQRFHYLGYDESDMIPESVLEKIEAGKSDTFNYDWEEGTHGQRANWVKQLNDLIEGKESGKFTESLIPLFDQAIEKARDTIETYDRVFNYDGTHRKSDLTETEYQMLQDIKNKPEEQRLPYEREALLKLESRRRWGTEFDVWSGLDVWPNDDDIPF